MYIHLYGASYEGIDKLHITAYLFEGLLKNLKKF